MTVPMIRVKVVNITALNSLSNTIRLHTGSTCRLMGTQTVDIKQATGIADGTLAQATRGQIHAISGETEVTYHLPLNLSIYRDVERCISEFELEIC